MSDTILKIVLPCIGLTIVLFCIGAYFFKYGANLKDNIQEFNMFGADLKISIITVFVLVGMILIFAGTYLNIVDSNTKLTKMLQDEKQKNDDYQKDLVDLQGQIKTLKLSENKTLDYFLDLDGIASLPDPNHLKICYKLWGSEDKEMPVKCTPVTQNDQKRLQITISDIKPESFITSLVVEDLKSNHKWKVNSFFPLSPSLKLTAIN